MDDIKWFAGFFVVMALLWLGGSNKGIESATRTSTSTPSSRTVAQPVKTPPKQASAPPKETAPRVLPGNVISEMTLPASSFSPELSPLYGMVKIVSIRRNSSADKEYVTLQASSRNISDVILSGLVLKSAVTFLGQEIPEAWTLPFPTYEGEGEMVVLRPGARAYIISGSSPNGQSFQLNKCTGYFEQGMNFVPTLPLRCPTPINDPLPLPPNELSDDCYNYLKRLGRCRVPPASVPVQLISDGSCQAHISSKINYNQCVTYYKDDPDFFQGDWHIYLDRNSRLWRDKNETVELLDRGGKLIDSRSY